MREPYIAEKASQMCGRLGAKLEQLNERHWNLVSRGLQEAADAAEKEMEKDQDLLERAGTRRNYPDRPKTDVGTQLLRGMTKPAEKQELMI